MKIVCFLKIVSDKWRSVANLNRWSWSNLPLSSKILISIPILATCMQRADTVKIILMLSIKYTDVLSVPSVRIQN